MVMLIEGLLIALTTTEERGDAYVSSIPRQAKRYSHLYGK